MTTETDAEAVLALPGRLDAAEAEVEAHVGEDAWGSEDEWLFSPAMTHKMFNASQAEFVVAAVRLFAASVGEDRALLELRDRIVGAPRTIQDAALDGAMVAALDHALAAASRRYAATGISPKEAAE